MKLDALLNQATQYSNMTVAVAAAEDEEVIEAVTMAVDRGMASFSLFGEKGKIRELLSQRGEQYVDNDFIKIVATNSIQESAERSVKAVSSGRADVLMKGMIPTAAILKAVLNKEYGLRKGGVLSHLAAFDIEGYDRLILLSDSAMNIAPDLGQKEQIINNAVETARSIGIEVPKVALVAAVELVNPAMQATLDAAALTQMNRRGQIKDCIVDGPLGLDNAVNLEAARHKGITGETPGQADVLIVPNIETGNILYKSLIYFAKASVGGIISGAKAPIVLTSRADTAESKLYSLGLAICTAQKKYVI